MISIRHITGVIGCMMWAACLPAQPFLNLDTDVTVEPAPAINTKHLEFSPMYYSSGIVYVFARDQDRFIDLKLGMPFFELMYAELGPDGMPVRTVSFSPNIRTRYHEGPCTFSPDEQQIYFTRSNYHRGQPVPGADGKIHLKIYTADKGPDDWENIREMPFCSDDYSTWAPALSADGRSLIFMSDMPGGYGGWDLYRSDMVGDKWEQPVNLGPQVNTPEHERFPFWHENGVLFFCSQGHEGMGGLDLFATRLQDDTWATPVNLGPKFNSKKDDLSLIIDEQGKSGFFASARKEGLGKDDIYAFHCSESLFDAAAFPPPQRKMNIVLQDAGSQRYLPEVALWVFPAESKSEMDTTHKAPQYTTDRAGKAVVTADATATISIVARKEGYEEARHRLNVRTLREGAPYVIALNPEPEAEGAMEASDCVVIGGNVRARTSGAVIASATIAIENQCTEVVRVIQSDADGDFSTCLSADCSYYFTVDKDGYLTESYTMRITETDSYKTVLMDEISLEERGGPLQVGDVLVLYHIHYDFNKSAIRTGDARELESLAKVMLRHPEMKIELQSHTDARGSKDYNLELSERRAVSVLDFLVARGVSSDRITLKPMGEEQLLNDCADGVPCTEEQHQENRRTEIKVLHVDEDVRVVHPDGE